MAEFERSEANIGTNRHHWPDQFSNDLSVLEAVRFEGSLFVRVKGFGSVKAADKVVLGGHRQRETPVDWIPWESSTFVKYEPACILTYVLRCSMSMPL